MNARVRAFVILGIGFLVGGASNATAKWSWQEPHAKVLPTGDLDWAPRNVWMVGKDGAVERIKLARTPNWKISDPEDIKSEWWTWLNPEKPFDNYATINGQRRHLAFDNEHINTNQPPEYYQDAIVWTTKGWVMGNPFPARVLAVDRNKGSLTFAGQWGGEPAYKIIRGCQYYLEDKPQYLDSPGEFWFNKKGKGGRLYLRLPGDPARILDEHWCMSAYYTGRDDYYKLPTYPLKGVNITLKDYQEGPLENWTTGALHFNGANQYAVLTNADICREVALDARGRSDSVKRTVSGAELSNPQIHTSDFLIEVFFKTAAGHTNGVLIQKIDSVGYVLGVNESGGVTLAATSGGFTAYLASRRSVNEGQWHHVIAEADRKAGTFAIYIDGKQDNSGPGLGADVSLANDADLYVGGAPNGHYLNGVLDFLRIARGTLADSKTRIEELCAWEFNGPFLDDFTGRQRPASGGCAGAIDEGSR